MMTPATPTNDEAKIALILQKTKEDFLKPRNKLVVSQWADTERRLSAEAAAEPGRWDTARAEYQRAIMDAFSDPTVHTVIVMSSAQIGKTSIIENVIGGHIDLDPCPILTVMPTLVLGEAFSKDRLATMIRDTPALREKISDAKSRSGDNNLLHKKFPGGQITIAGANSPASLASRPVRLVLCDEVDRFPDSAGAEGDPVDLATKRSTTFWNKKHGLFSTPTIKGASRIEEAFLASDQRHFYVPCPDCGHPQILRWKQVHWEKRDGKHLPGTAVYVCESCGSCWTDAARWGAINQGYWKAHGDFDGVAGFWLNEFYSPWVKLASPVKSFLEVKEKPERLKTWVNTTAGETFEEKGESVEDSALLNRIEDYRPEALPAGILVLTAAVDVQDNRLEVLVVGWGHKEEAWHVERFILYGDPATVELWEELENVLLKTAYDTEDGRRLRVKGGCVDTGGHHTQAAYDFCRPKKIWRRNIWAIKGKSDANRTVWPASYSKANKGKVPLFTIGVDAAKEAIYARLNKIPEAGPGFIHFSAECDSNYFKQLTAEKKIKRTHKGRTKYVWVKIRERNEVLDLWVYNYAALCGLKQQKRLNLERLWKRIQAQGSATQEAPLPPGSPGNGVSTSTGEIIHADDPYLQE